MDTRLSLTEIEAKALRLIQKACPSELMDVVALKSDQKSRLIFVVLQCKGADTDRLPEAVNIPPGAE